ncbi:DNA replication and repair protein RecF [Candidatus Gottesmanbacteria bacterium]|nr:DNA replication and repair protein RecF [Candidatus Gottesmanbacteria bacterium]
MILTRLALSNFRQYIKRNLSLSPKTTVLVGSNAIGKTNLLESIYLLSYGKSFHTSDEREMISFTKEFARVKGEFQEDVTLEVFLTRGEVEKIRTPYKKFTVNGVGKRLVDFTGNLKVVLFWPLDLDLVTDSPSLRRKYLSNVLVQVDHEYRRCLLSYERGLRQRNKILENIREGKASQSQLPFWNQLLIKTGSYITQKRRQYIDFVNTFHPPHEAFQGMRYRLVYDTSVISDDRLAKYKDAEIASGVTLVGPHRDDVIIEITLKEASNSFKNLSHFGSRGEQRLGVLFIKIAELQFIQEQTGVTPLFLLDDILSELDHKHRQIIFEMTKNQQTIMTTTDLHFIDKKHLSRVELVSLP